MSAAGLPPLTPKVLLLLVIPPLMWAGNAVVGRAMVGEVPPLLLNALRWTLALALLLPLGWSALATAEARAGLLRRWRELLLLSLMGVGLYNTFQYAALITSTPLNVTLIAASTPMWMLAVGVLVHGERARAPAVAGALLSGLGAVVVLCRGDLAQLSRVQFARGDLLMLMAVISWAFYSWMLARPAPSLRGEARPPWGWAEFMLVQALFGMVWTWLFASAEHLLSPARVVWSWGVVAAVAFVAVGPSVLAYRCWTGGVAAAGPAVASMFGNLTPLFAALMSGALLGEWPQGYHVAAFGLIVAGITLSALRRA